MKLLELIAGIEGAEIAGDNGIEISGVKLDSRSVQQGDLFIAIPGFKTNGAKYVREARAKGAAAVAIEAGTEKNGIPVVVLKNARQNAGMIAKTFYRAPDERLHLWGITGTNGKTTIAHLIAAILKESGRNISLFGTIHNEVGEEILPAPMTTLEAADLYALFDKTLQRGGDTVVMEVSSHALSLHRVAGMRFAVGVFTNLTQDHLDFHGGFEAYFSAKTRLFVDHLLPKGYAIINWDDPYGKSLGDIISEKRGDIKRVTFGNGPHADIYPLTHSTSWEGLSLSLHTPVGRINLQSPLCGSFHVENIMATVGACLSQGLDPQIIRKALSGFRSVRGRFESVRAGQSFGVVIDYAHTPDGLEKLLNSARQLTKGRLITVFGCGGDRDKLKRPKMGAISANLSDTVLVTSDNPRTEEPAVIVQEILSGIDDKAKITVELDRRTAIENALRLAKQNDCVVIAGKGHEDYQIIGENKIHFDDREVVQNFLLHKGAKR